MENMEGVVDEDNYSLDSDSSDSSDDEDVQNELLWRMLQHKVKEQVLVHNTGSGICTQSSLLKLVSKEINNFLLYPPYAVVFVYLKYKMSDHVFQILSSFL